MQSHPHKDFLLSSLTFKSENLEKSSEFRDNIAFLLATYPELDSYINSFIECKNIYDFFLLVKLLWDSKYLSFAMAGLVGVEIGAFIGLPLLQDLFYEEHKVITSKNNRNISNNK